MYCCCWKTWDNKISKYRAHHSQAKSMWSTEPTAAIEQDQDIQQKTQTKPRWEPVGAKRQLGQTRPGIQRQEPASVRPAWDMTGAPEERPVVGVWSKKSKQHTGPKRGWRTSKHGRAEREGLREKFGEVQLSKWGHGCNIGQPWSKNKMIVNLIWHWDI